MKPKQNYKLTREQIHEIRNKLADGERDKVLAIDYDVTDRSINRIRHGYKWKWEKQA